MVEDKAIQDARRRMMTAIRKDISETRRWTGLRTFSGAVMNAMETVPRHEFIEGVEPYAAYANRPCPIGHGQTISQPYIVALMTELLQLKPTDRALEIGGGCGYQTAVLAEVAGDVYSVELIEHLAHAAEKRLKRLGYSDRIHIRCGDGNEGWEDEAPFDAIMVTAAPETMPEKLPFQLKPGGRLVIPLGKVHQPQMLYRITRHGDEDFGEEAILPVAFVPLVAQK